MSERASLTLVFVERPDSVFGSERRSDGNGHLLAIAQSSLSRRDIVTTGPLYSPHRRTAHRTSQYTHESQRGPAARIPRSRQPSMISLLPACRLANCIDRREGKCTLRIARDDDHLCSSQRDQVR